jgi:hypothetical protein
MSIHTIYNDADGSKLAENIEAPDEEFHARRQPSLFKQIPDEWKGTQRRPAMSKSRWELLFK